MLTIVPCTVAQANAYVAQHHRHHQPVTCSRFALAVADEYGQAGEATERFIDDFTKKMRQSPAGTLFSEARESALLRSSQRCSVRAQIC